MKVGKEYPSCRYWGYELAVRELVGNPMNGLQERILYREQEKRERATVKDAGFKPSAMGLTKAKAIAQATLLEERFPGIEWHVFNHDYL